MAPGVPFGPRSRWLAAIPVLCMGLLLAGTPLDVPVAGRILSVGPFEAGLALILLLVPTWWRRLPPLTAYTAAGVAFIWWCGASTFWSLDPRRSVMATVVLAEAVLVFVVCYNVFTIATRAAFLASLRTFGILLSLQILWVVYGIVAAGDPQQFYAYKNQELLPLGGTNYLAIFLEFCVVYEVVRRPRWWLAVAALEGVALVLTFSRGAVASMAVALTLVTIVFLKRRGERRAALAVITVVALGGLTVVLVPMGRLLIAAFGALARAASLRVELWSYALDAAKGAPFTGVGFGAYEMVGIESKPHSALFRLLGETGVPGVLLFALLIGGFVTVTVRLALDRRADAGRRQEARALGLALVPVLAHSLIEPFFFDRSAFWLAVVLAWIAALRGTPAFAPDRRTPTTGATGVTTV